MVDRGLIEDEPPPEASAVADPGRLGQPSDGAHLELWRRQSWGPPLLIWAASLLFLKWRSTYPWVDLFLPPSWGRWDTGQYLAIARIGYSATWTCPAHSLPPRVPPGDYLCGRIGWFPGYPMAVRLVSWLPAVSIPVAGLVVSWIAWYLLLALMWRLLGEEPVSPQRRWAALAAAAFAPGSVYFAALFPISLCIAAMLLALHMVLQSNARAAPVYALLAAAVASYSYLTAIVLAPAMLVTATLMLAGRRRVSALAAGAGSMAGLGAVLLHMQLSVGIWNAYFISVRKYGVGAHNPARTLVDRITPVWREPTGPESFLRTEAFQTVLTATIVVVVVITTLTAALVPSFRPSVPRSSVEAQADDRYWFAGVGRLIRARISAFDFCFLITAIGVWMVPYIAGGAASTYRSEAFVVLAVPLLRRLPAPAVLVVVALNVWVAAYMVPLFVDFQLI